MRSITDTRLDRLGREPRYDLEVIPFFVDGRIDHAGFFQHWHVRIDGIPEGSFVVFSLVRSLFPLIPLQQKRIQIA